MSTLGEIALAVLLLVGSGFVLVGSLGLVKLSDFFKRLHGPTKASTLGVGCILIASIVFHASLGDGLGLREGLVTLFLFITAPVSAHLMARAAMQLVPALRPSPPSLRPGGGDDGEGGDRLDAGDRLHDGDRRDGEDLPRQGDRPGSH